MPAEKQYISAEDFWELTQLPEYADRSLELVEGKIVDMSKPTLGHGVITMMLGVKIANHVFENDLGWVTAADTGFVLKRNPEGKDTVRGLDIAFISKAKLPESPPFELTELALDLAVEVISPGNRADDIHKKIRQLLNAGTALIWIVYAATRTVTVHIPAGAVTREESDTLSGGAVLPGLEIRVGDIFSV